MDLPHAKKAIAELINRSLLKPSPGELSEILTELTGWGSYLHERLQEILARRAPEWLKIRETTTSDSRANKMWDATEDGINEMKIRYTLVHLKEHCSSIRAQLRSRHDEAQGQY